VVQNKYFCYLNKAQTKAITDIRNTSEEAFQDIVNKAKYLSEPKREKSKQSSNTEDNVTLREMSVKEIKQTADKIIKKEIKNERNRQRENQYLNLKAKVLIMTRLGINNLEGGIINIGNFSVGINS